MLKAAAACLLLVAGCSSQPAILLTVSGDQPAQQYQLWVHDDDTSALVYSTGWTSVSTPGQPPLDLTKESLKLALKLSRAGHFTLLMVGVIGEIVDGKPSPTSTVMFWGQKLNITGTNSVNAEMITVPPGDDADGDYWPDAGPFRAHVPAAARLYAGKDTVLDCDDKTDNPKTPAGVVVPLKAAQINPFAQPICGIDYSVSCDGTKDPCVDKDGDHDVRGHDCDDSDPKRHHPTDIDPYPDPPNCCGYSLGKQGTPDEFTDFLYGRTTHYAATYKPDKMLCPAKRCGDGIDESCKGITNAASNDTTCIVDEDCDGYPAPPQGNDCDDHDPTVHPGAAEPCGSTKDMNCNKTIGEGCVPCDLDGDGYERSDPKNNCPDKNDKHPGMVDCNDDDAGVFPGSTTITGGSEAGVGIGVVAAGLRGNCRNVYESVNGGTLTPRINAFGGLVGDVDCNGMAYQGCPGAIDPACDKDGDGFPGVASINGKNCNPDNRQLDCDDSDPTTFPGAPDNCKTAKNENCVTPVPDCSQDADGDGYLKGSDCNDNDPNIHPWATELCNGVDDDCDQLTDEGNPDPTGKPLVNGGAITSCTDSNTGECGKQLGSCVCSSSTPVVDPLLGQLAQPRTMCPGEGAMPRGAGCFGAGQPAPQSCDATNPKDDDCDGRVDAPDGVRLAAKGMTCGINVGQCKAGIVVGCDMSMTNCFTAFNRLPLSSGWLVCSSAAPNPITVCPAAEVCNGLDDDCDGHVPGDTTPPPAQNMPGTPPDEFDHDRDGYMACQGCAGHTLAPGISGCGDCNDGDNTIHPGQPDVCDGLDNACAAYNGGTFTDGKDDCKTAPKTTCCGANGCQDIQNETFPTSGNYYCGSCTPDPPTCPLAQADRCLNGACSCGTSGAPCPMTKACQNGHCVVGAGAACPNGQSDCISGTTCVDGFCCTKSSCPTCQQCTGSGGTCVFTMRGSDPPNGSCTSPQLCDGAGHCLNGLGQSCINTMNKSDNTLCYNGICQDGVCCDMACGGQCQYCDGTGHCVQRTGQPLVNPANITPPRSDCAGSGTNCYGHCDNTIGELACDYPGNATACPSTCTAGSNNTPAKIQDLMCNGAGGCVNNGSAGSCGTAQEPNTISTVTCATSMGSGVCLPNCASDSDCISNDYCSSANAPDGSSGTCATKKSNGASCGTADCQSSPCGECSSGNCQSSGQCCKNGVTCPQSPTCSSGTVSQAHTMCDTNGNCTGAQTTCTTGYACSSTTGACVAPGGCKGDNDCATDYYCDGSGNCVGVKQSGASCGYTADCFNGGKCSECLNKMMTMVGQCSKDVGGSCP